MQPWRGPETCWERDELWFPFLTYWKFTSRVSQCKCGSLKKFLFTTIERILKCALESWQFLWAVLYLQLYEFPSWLPSFSFALKERHVKSQMGNVTLWQNIELRSWCQNLLTSYQRLELKYGDIARLFELTWGRSEIRDVQSPAALTFQGDNSASEM